MMVFYLSPLAPDNLVSRDGFGSPAPRQPAHLHTQADSGAYFRSAAASIYLLSGHVEVPTEDRRMRLLILM